MSDLGEVNYCVGLQIYKLHDGLFLSQSKHVLDI